MASQAPLAAARATPATTPSPEPPSQAALPTAPCLEPPAGAESPQPGLRVIAISPIEWNDWDVRLAGVNEDTGRVVLWLESASAVSIRAIDYRTGQEAERWDAAPRRRISAGRFYALSSSLRRDVARYAGLLGSDDGSYKTPGVLVPPGGRYVFYGRDLPNGHDGDAWQVASPAGSPLFLFAPILTAYYDLAFSANGNHVAWSGCCHETTPGGDPYHLYLARIDGKPRAVLTVPHPGRPLFDPSGKTVFVTSHPSVLRMCLHRVPFSGPGRSQKLFCRASGDHESHVFFAGADDLRLIIANPRSKVGDYELILADPADGSILAVVAAPTSHLSPIVLDRLRVLVQVRQGLGLADLQARTLTTFDESVLGGYLSYPTAVRPAHLPPFILAIRGQRGTSSRDELVRIELPRIQLPGSKQNESHERH